ncbi:MBL fold metallo-hydrolase [Alteromonas sediminis]|uniref:MBL fold metallo-hydrolase n=1 Tax=Alteromonas sediminis TaxID=2259342 RepID=A0A3N5ZAR7_9ALTE|nr:MBL fold metallo-hydrolase [Alteromonas sediminis]RPJ66638.1 MBL fold metallo-hydrolase [Alteromonas sediminis]
MKLFILTAFFYIAVATAHPTHEHKDNVAHYLGNEAVLVESGEHKVLFDPFFHNGFGIYQKVPHNIRQAIFKGEIPYNNVNMIVISHAHEDHFSADDVARYMTLHPTVKLVAPQQAINLLSSDHVSAMKERIYAIELAFNSSPWQKQIEGVHVEAVRIPHAGWPGRADVENLVFRLSFANTATVIHMGDADPQIEHYQAYQSHWNKRDTQIGFPPYWFLEGAEGRYILEKTLRVKQAVGVHVPIKVPLKLQQTELDYFSKPGEKREF